MGTVTAEEIEALVIETLASFGPERSTLTRTATLDEVDLDSLDVVELAQVLEDEYEIEVDTERYLGVITIGDLIDRTLAIVQETRAE
jgi:acyl carrier protein